MKTVEAPTALTVEVAMLARQFGGIRQGSFDALRMWNFTEEGLASLIAHVRTRAVADAATPTPTPLREEITWHAMVPGTPHGLPDAETNVLLALADGTSCEGFYDGDNDAHEDRPPLFRDVTADALDRDVVIAWANLPKGPARSEA